MFSTKERDFSTGLDYFGFRYYDAVLGKFTTRDPSGYPDGPNNYLYVNNNPINVIDPLGLSEETIEDFQGEDPKKREAFEEEKEEAKRQNDLNEKQLKSDAESLLRLKSFNASIDLSKMDETSADYKRAKWNKSFLRVSIEKVQGRIKSNTKAILMYKLFYVKDPSWEGKDLASHYEQESTKREFKVIGGSVDVGIGVALKTILKTAATKYTTSMASRALAKDLIKKIGPRLKGMQAAHLIPTGEFVKRSEVVQKSIRIAQTKFDGLLGVTNRNTVINGFWAKAGHLGTHKDKFFLELGRVTKNVKDAPQLTKVLKNLKQRVIDGEFLK